MGYYPHLLNIHKITKSDHMVFLHLGICKHCPKSALDVGTFLLTRTQGGRYEHEDVELGFAYLYESNSKIKFSL